MKRFVPSIYYNAIKFREPRQVPEYTPSGLIMALEASFDTWELAHEALVERRRTEVESAENLLRVKIRRSKLARAMVNPARGDGRKAGKP